MPASQTYSVEAAEYARHVVWALCGRRWTWPQRRVTDRYSQPFAAGRAILQSRPVTAVESIQTSYDGSADEPVVWDPATYRLVKPGTILLPMSYPGCGGCTARVDITYVYGSAPPAVADLAATRLAEQVKMAWNEDPDCALPDRVKSVSRQGVSWELIDPQEFLDEGRTGLYEVDLAIRILNPSRSVMRARVFTGPPPDRLSSEVVTTEDE